MQLSLLDEVPAEDETTGDALFAPNGNQRCEHCRERLVAFGGRLLCANPYCPGVTR